jgi:hypothetical protein
MMQGNFNALPHVIAVRNGKIVGQRAVLSGEDKIPWKGFTDLWESALVR